MKSNPNKYICIEGNIGAGKTTFCQMISLDYKCKLILEQFSDNPFLEYFYKDPARYALTVELFFLTERQSKYNKTPKVLIYLMILLFQIIPF
ncbi:MAG: deoxynucleoside kinase [Saprospiraceae bacterium]|nr:deoxynucleoside kinase [Saprospiraceae bacterium]